MQKFAAFLLSCLSLPVYAEQLICQGHLRNKSIHADLIVEQKCILDNAKITGSIQVQQHGSLVLKRSQVSGDIVADHYFSGIHIEESRIGGNLNITSGREVKLIKNQVDGDINLQNNLGAITLKHNQSQALICIHNRVAPIGMQNQAAEKIEQCQAL